MWRFLAGVTSALLFVGAGLFLWKGIAQSENPVPPPSQPLVLKPEPLTPPPAAERSREEKRFDRYDKDRDEIISEAEYLAPRHKAFAKLDTNGDGRLSFEEWAVRTTDKFGKADGDRSKALDRQEFATTRPKRSSRPVCACPQESD
jgi:hypothetical protein